MLQNNGESKNTNPNLTHFFKAMPDTTSPPPLSSDLLDGLLNGLRRVAAVADLLETIGSCAEGAHLLDGTLAEAGGIIGKEAAHMLALIRSSERNPPAP